MQRIVSLFLVLAYLVSPLAGAQGLVLCYGADGHAEVEVAANGGCGHLAVACEAEREVKQFLSVPGGHCGLCEDVPLVSANDRVPFARTGTMVSKVTLDLLGEGSYFGALPFKATFSYLSQVQPDVDRPSLTSLRTVVLLI